MSETLKSKATNGIFWSAIDKVAVQLGHFFFGLVLARILMPGDFGLVGMLSIFIAISQVFINSGMGSGLIQKQDRTNVDFSTVFVFNFVVSSLFYIVLFAMAPLISEFYNQPLLTPLTRILGLNLIIYSLAIVQRSKLTIAIDFKSIAKVNMIGVFVGGTSGLFAAIYGFGVWSLVIQTISGSIATVGSLWLFSKWKPSLFFSKKSFLVLFGYGSKILAAGLYSQILQNIYNIAIGKIYPATELGYYTRAKQLADVTSGTVSGILEQVTFPILSSVQNDKSRLVSIYRRTIKMSSFVIIPIMVLIAILAEPLVLVILTDKWASIIPLLQWMVFAQIFYPISSINMNILKAIGRSDLYLKVDLVKFPIIILALMVTIPMGIRAIIIGHVITSVIYFFINAYIPGRLIGYGGIKQTLDMMPHIISAAVMALCVYLFIISFQSHILMIIIGSIIGMFIYCLIAYFLKVQELKEIRLLVFNILHRNK